MTMIVAAALVSGDSILLCHRHPSREWYPNVWDLPGGHVEPDEPPSEALERELSEELAVMVKFGPTPAVSLELGDDMTMWIWVATDWEGDIANAAPEEHDMLGWFTQGDLVDLPLADQRYHTIIPNLMSAPGAGQVAAPQQPPDP